MAVGANIRACPSKGLLASNAGAPNECGDWRPIFFAGQAVFSSSPVGLQGVSGLSRSYNFLVGRRSFEEYYFFSAC